MVAMTGKPVLFGVPDDEQYAAYGARLLATWITATLRGKERCTVALSGGSTPIATYRALAEMDGIEWKRVRMLLADERCVPSTDAKSNARLMNDAFGNVMESQNLLAPNTHLAPLACADDYEKRVLALLGNEPIDILVLGMGEDGHIASLFPPVKNDALVRMGAVHTLTKRFDVEDRISLTLPLLKRSSHRLLLLAGEKKLAVLDACVAAEHDPKRWPLQELWDGRLTVLTDRPDPQAALRAPDGAQ